MYYLADRSGGQITTKCQQAARTRRSRLAEIPDDHFGRPQGSDVSLVRLRTQRLRARAAIGSCPLCPYGPIWLSTLTTAARMRQPRINSRTFSAWTRIPHSRIFGWAC